MEALKDYQGGRAMTRADLDEVGLEVAYICVLHDSVAADNQPPAKYNSWKVYALLGLLTGCLCAAVLIL